jgi:glycosyltransferase involved in cell wall biosynthesis
MFPNKKKPKRNNGFSVLMSVYAKETPERLKTALDSVLYSSIQPTEVVLVQDGPIGIELLKIINQSSKVITIKHVILKNNMGLARALNEGLKHISTQFVFRADSDDFNCSNRFSKQLKVLKRGYDLVGSSVLEKDSNGRPTSIKKVPTNSSDIVKYLKIRNPFNHMTVAFRHSFVSRLGGYPNIHLREDYALWALFLAKNARVCNIDEVLVEASAGSEMYQRRGGFRLLVSEYQIQCLLVRLKFQSIYGGICTWFIKVPFYLSPAFLRGFLYKKFLRENLPNSRM